MIRVILVDDHDLFCEGLRAVLARDSDFAVVATAGDAATARRVFAAQPCDVGIIDVSLPTSNGNALVRDLRRDAPRLPLLMLSMHHFPDVVADALDAGATGYALKNQSPDELFHAVRTVAAGGRYLAPRLSALAAVAEGRRPPLGLLRGLSKREREVFDLLIHGHSNQDISTHLFISVKTVETHRMRIMKKLSVHSIVELIRLAARHGHLEQEQAVGPGETTATNGPEPATSSYDRLLAMKTAAFGVPDRGGMDEDDEEQASVLAKEAESA
jgi:DNA-binding NarL/FixJ family response regulator